MAGPSSERRTRRVKQPNPAVINRERKDTAIAGPSSERRTRRVKQLNPAVIQREINEGHSNGWTQ